jgi:hypothetical protein
MNSLRDFFATYFGWRPTAAQILWTPVILVATRIVLWMWEQPLPRGELMYWLIGAPLLLLVGVVTSYAARTSRPQLVGSIDRIHIMEASQVTKAPEHAHSMAILLTVSVRNKGTASIADVWELAIRIKDSKQTIETIPVYIPPMVQLNMHDKVTGALTSFLGADAMYNKSVVTPIVPGAMVRGLLMYLVSGVTDPILTVPGTKYILKFSNINGRKHEIVYAWPAVPDRRAGYMAGMLEVPGTGLTVASEAPPKPPTAASG